MEGRDTFQSFWYGSALSPLAWLCLTSFVKRGLDVDLFVYGGSLRVPQGVRLRDAREIYPEDRVFFYQHGAGKGSVAAFANMFRYKLLYERGGWWVDTDVMYTGAPIPSCMTYFGQQDEYTINSAILRFERNSPIMCACMERAEAMGTGVRWGQAGPKLMTQVVREHGRTDEAYPPRYAYPVEWPRAPAFYDPDWLEEIDDRIASSSVAFVHVWNNILRRVGIQKSIAPPLGSYLSREAEALGVSWPYPELRYTSKAVRRMACCYNAWWERYQLKERRRRS